MNFSVVIPVYNRPEEIDELLASLQKQSRLNFEVLVVDDGSTIDCRSVVEKYNEVLDVKYFYKENTGPGYSRNYGTERAQYDYIVIFDSDAIIPQHYFATVEDTLKNDFADAYGGPDRWHKNFSPIQKAISYSMTSFFTTGGIRGGAKQMEQFYPRSFNMGFAKYVYNKTGGFLDIWFQKYLNRYGEDLDFSMRIVEAGFKTRLIRQAYVYHKRRTTYRKFFKQVFVSAIARVNLYPRHPKTFKIVHTFPSLFFLGSILLILLAFWRLWFLLPLVLYIILIFVDASIRFGNIKDGFNAVIASFVQLTGYGAGFLRGLWDSIFRKA